MKTKLILLLLLLSSVLLYGQSVPYTVDSLNKVPSMTWIGVGRIILVGENNQLYKIGTTNDFPLGGPPYKSIAISGGTYANAVVVDYPNIGNDLTLTEAIDSAAAGSGDGNGIKDDLIAEPDKLLITNYNGDYSFANGVSLADSYFDTLPLINGTFDTDISGWTNEGVADWYWEGGYLTKGFFSDTVSLTQVVPVSPVNQNRPIIFEIFKYNHETPVTVSINDDQFIITKPFGKYVFSSTLLANVDSVRINLFTPSGWRQPRIDDIVIGIGREGLLDVDVPTEMRNVTITEKATLVQSEGILFTDDSGEIKSDSSFMFINEDSNNANDKTIVFTKNLSGGPPTPDYFVTPSSLPDRYALQVLTSRSGESDLVLHGTSFGLSRPNLRIDYTESLTDSYTESLNWVIHPTAQLTDTSLTISYSELSNPFTQLVRFTTDGHVRLAGFGADSNGNNGDYSSLQNNDLTPLGKVKQIVSDSVATVNTIYNSNGSLAGTTRSVTMGPGAQLQLVDEGNFTRFVNDFNSGFGTSTGNTILQGISIFEDDNMGDQFSLGATDSKWLMDATLNIEIRSLLGLDLIGGSTSGVKVGSNPTNTYRLPTRRPSEEALPAGTYVPVVTETGAQAGTAGWINTADIGISNNITKVTSAQGNTTIVLSANHTVWINNTSGTLTVTLDTSNLQEGDILNIVLNDNAGGITVDFVDGTDRFIDGSSETTTIGTSGGGISASYVYAERWTGGGNAFHTVGWRGF